MIRKISSEISTVVAEPVVNLVNGIGTALFLCHFVSVGGVFLFTFGITAQALVILTLNDYQLVADTTVSDFFVALVKYIRIYLYKPDKAVIGYICDLAFPISIVVANMSIVIGAVAANGTGHIQIINIAFLDFRQISV